MKQKMMMKHAVTESVFPLLKLISRLPDRKIGRRRNNLHLSSRCS